MYVLLSNSFVKEEFYHDSDDEIYKNGFKIPSLRNSASGKME